MAHPPRANPKINIKTLPLCPEEAFVLSRVDGQALAKDIALTTGMTTDRVERALSRLSELVAVEGWASAQPSVSQRSPAITSNPPIEAASLGRVGTDDSFEPVPDIDISLGDQQKIWRLWKRLEHSNHYELLGLGRAATRDQVKGAYFEQVAAFHPDKHFGKRLGTYKDKLEAVFQRLTLAHDTLSRSKRREQYDATLPPEVPSAGSQHPASREPQAEPTPASKSALPIERPPIDAAATQAGKVARPPPPPRRTSNGPAPAPSSRPRASVPPVSSDQRRQVAIRSLERGLRAIPGGGRSAGRGTSSTPSRRSPSSPPSSRSQQLDGALNAERSGDWAGAANAYEKLAQVRKEAHLFAKAAECLERQFAEQSVKEPALLKRAAESARRAVHLSPDNPQLRVLLSHVYAAAGMQASAVREAERAQELSPSDKSVQSWLERVRRRDV